jgi:hypothetical protein
MRAQHPLGQGQGEDPAFKFLLGHGKSDFHIDLSIDLARSCLDFILPMARLRMSVGDLSMATSGWPDGRKSPGED